jgi:hypothetical protein
MTFSGIFCWEHFENDIATDRAYEFLIAKVKEDYKLIGNCLEPISFNKAS